MKSIEKFLIPGALALAMASPAAAQMMTPEWDLDGDAALSADEFNTGFTEGGKFTTYDSDGDGFLSEMEYDTAFTDRETVFEEREYEMGAFSDYDADGDGLLNEEEYNTSWFDTYDADGSGMLDENEMTYVDEDMGEDGLFDL
ncbi:hypothetical protein MWU52_05550 [Jannaschia sp. S6380]|uniref:hypothetical protein n=1 Tax=Jannaschia sp. S6380 TaxID=2926408 RepID=UPI001FF1F257|nr:hypothetical protein [Jannaschia sp. S6380]MCK0167011.1 hypothetical protein [Jannaschia sp. S6380]